MLRVGLTGGLGSGKSTVAALLAKRGARVFSSDEIGRELMQPGQAVYDAIVARFGAVVVRADGSLDRSMLARLAFGEGRVEELNSIVHPAVIAEQARRVDEIGARDPGSVIVVESALLFETKHGKTQGEPWRARFDCLVLVTADDAAKVARFAARSAGGRVLDPKALADLADEARRRLARQMPDAQKAAAAEYVLANDGSIEELAQRVDALWAKLQARAEGVDRDGLAGRPR